MPLKFGLHVGPQDCTYEELRRVWRWADDSGFHWVSVWDHHFESPPVDGTHPAFEAVSIMTALAAETRKVRVGCLVFCAAYRNPALLAKAITTIDHVSGGRAELGIGAGWHKPEFDAFGYDFPSVKVREDMLEEAVQIIQPMLHDGRATFAGVHFRAQDAYCVPRSVQARLPIWVGGGGERRTLRTTARYADACNVPYVPPDVFRHKMAVLERWCDEFGRDPTPIARAVNLHFLMGTDQASAERKRQAPVVQGGGALVGASGEVAERLGAYVEAGAQQVNLALRAPFDWDALQAFVEEVMPSMR